MNGAAVPASATTPCVRPDRNSLFPPSETATAKEGAVRNSCSRGAKAAPAPSQIYSAASGAEQAVGTRTDR